MKKHSLILSALLVVAVCSFTNIQKADAAVANLTITVMNGLTITDTSNTTNPQNVAIAITPDVGAAAQTGNANFYIRSNYPTWSLTALRSALSDPSSTGLALTDIGYAVTLGTHGTNANASAGAVAGSFASTTLNTLTTSAQAIVTGSAKTSSARDSANTQNFFKVNNAFTVNQDFFFSPGVVTVSVTYALTAI